MGAKSPGALTFKLVMDLLGHYILEDLCLGLRALSPSYFLANHFIYPLGARSLLTLAIKFAMLRFALTFGVSVPCFGA